MAVLDAAAFAAAVSPPTRLVGLDLGTKTIGFAVGDGAWMVAAPVTTIRRRKLQPDLDTLFALMDERRAGGIVLGLPVNMDGSEGPRCQATRAFARELLKRRDLPILLWDERLSTSAVERQMIEAADMSRRRRAQEVDQAAAAYILQGALDALRRRRPDPAS
ncbi:MAG: Holliday junction resolvase RuvX [Alphaproteobacteria bacterium]